MIVYFFNLVYKLMLRFKFYNSFVWIWYTGVIKTESSLKQRNANIGM